MEKLLNLLQEFYWENRKFSNDDWLLTMTNWVENLSGAYAQTYIISLKGGFIKWLVENDKIRDLDKLEYVYWIEMVRHWTEELYTAYSLYENLLMLLAIQDEPIDFLCSILK